ncbi:MAG: hypothetical protein HY901_36100 [Deltaproteobacteria bacterium]|nr:hypothetical protein [Deltaproteobacteria bacterium]
MLIARLHRSLREDEAGQALVLGALSVLVLALCVLVTAHLGRAVDQRIQVQNAADATAYSVAVAVARSLNFTAWVNRAIVSQFVAAMAAQTLVAMVDGLEAWLGSTSDMLQTLSSMACTLAQTFQACCPLVAACCGAAAFLRGLQPVLQSAATALRSAAPVVRRISEAIDPAIAAFVAGVAQLNKWGMAGAQKAMRDMTAAALATTGREGLQGRIMRGVAGRTNEEGIGLVYDAAMAANAESYLRLFDHEGSEKIDDPGHLRHPGNYHAEDRGQRAERMMAEITNASRTGDADSERTWETNAGLDAKASGLLGATARLGRSLGGTVVGAQTRLVNVMTPHRFTEAKGAQNFVFTSGRDTTQSTRGAAMASPAAAQPGFSSPWLAGGGRPVIVSVQATWDRAYRLHCRYDGRTLVSSPGCPDRAETRPVRCVSEPRHAFEGVTPYLSFDAQNDSQTLFNQRDFFAMVHKAGRDAMLPVEVLKPGGQLSAQWAGGYRTELAVPTFGSGVLEGLNGWARSRVYYHRPGHWTEPPNLFNPFWKAKLGPFAGSRPTQRLPHVDGELKEALDSLLVH